MKRLTATVLLLSAWALLLLVGCPDVSEEQVVEKMIGQTDYKKAIVVLHPTEGYDVQGIVTFTKVENGIEVVADVTGLTPGKHGFHIHEYGDCSFADATSAGGHFNPTDMPHGAPTDKQRHVGDLGNLVADDDGNAHYEWTDTLLTLNGFNSIIGRAVIVHQGEDDLESQPTGNAGPRVACGVIGIARGESGE